jgi:hypothetical protein
MLTLTSVRNERYYYDGGRWASVQPFCNLQVWQSMDKQYLVIMVSQHPENQGASIQKCAETIIAALWAEYGYPRHVLYLEHWPQIGSGLRPISPEHWFRVWFKVKRNQFLGGAWVDVSREEMTALQTMEEFSWPEGWETDLPRHDGKKCLICLRTSDEILAQYSSNSLSMHEVFIDRTSEHINVCQYCTHSVLATALNYPYSEDIVKKSRILLEVYDEAIG